MIEFKPVTRTIGAEVCGVDLRNTLSNAEVAEIRHGLLRHGVLFLRDQHITDDQQVAFARRFGPLSIPPMQHSHDTPGIHVLNQTSPKGEGGDEWHTDNTFMPSPPMASILRAVVLPSVGGDTCWASTYAAYDALSPQLKVLVESLTGVHDLTNSVSKAIAKGHPLDLGAMQHKWPPVEHPVVRVHEETGRKALYVNRSSTTHLAGVPVRESETLLPFLQDHIRSPEFQCRLHWEVGTIAMWDNRATQHYAVADYTQRREMHRVTVDYDNAATHLR